MGCENTIQLIAKAKEMRQTVELGAVELLRIDDIERLTKISRRTLWRWTASGRFPQPAVREGRIVRWRASDIEGWIEGQARRNPLADVDKSGSGGAS